MRRHRLAGLLLLLTLLGSALGADSAREAIAEFKRRFAPGMNTLTRNGAIDRLTKVADEDALKAFAWGYELTVRTIRHKRAEKGDTAKDLEKLEQQLADISQRAFDRAKKAGLPPPTSIPVPASLMQAAEKARREVEQLQVEIDAEFGIRDRLADGLGAWLGAVADDVAAEAMLAIGKKGLRNRDPGVRAFHVRALGATSHPLARALLLERLNVEKDARHLPSIVDAIARNGGDRAVQALAAALSHERWQVRAAAVAALARVGAPNAIQPLIDRLQLEEGRLRGDIATALRILTEENLGYSAERWQQWWDENREGFVPPRDRKPPEDVADASEDGDPAKPDKKPGGEFGAEPEPKPKPAPVPKDRPSFYGIEILSKHVVFVIDISGSMNQPATSYDNDRTKIEVAKRELERAILALPDDAQFNIVSYNAEVAIWRKGMIVAKRANRRAAEKYVARMTAEGGTNIHDALKSAFAIAGRGARDKQYELGADTIFFLSDGQPTRGDITDPDQILAEVKRWNLLRRVKVHTVGVGRDHAKAFMESLAESSGGTYVRR